MQTSIEEGKFSEMSSTRLLSLLGLFVVAAAPLALYSWHVLSEALAGRADLPSSSLAFVFCLAFLVLAKLLGRHLTRVRAS